MADKRKRTYKPLTREQQDEKNRKQRERNARLKETAPELTSEERRSLGKAVERRPDLADKLLSFFTKPLAALDKIGEVVTGEKSGVLGSGGGTSPVTSKVTPRRPQSSKRQTSKGLTNEEKWRNFVEAHKGLPKNEVNRRARAAGLSISNVRANDIWRDVNERTINPKKVTKITYTPNSKHKLFKHWKDGEEVYKRYVKKRYVHLMQFMVGNKDYSEPRWITIVTPKPVPFSTLVDETESEWNDDNEESKYDPLEIIEGSIELVYAVDMDK